MPRTLLLQHTIDAPVETLFEFFSDFAKYGEMHPLMTSVKAMGDNNYAVKEKVRLAPFIYLFPSYSARVAANADRRSIVYSASLPMLTLSINIQLAIIDGGSSTSVSEEVVVNGPRLFSGILLHFIRASHTEIYRKLGEKYSPVHCKHAAQPDSAN